MPQKQKTRSHHKKKAKPNKRSAEGVVKKELSEDGNANHYPGTEFDKPEVKVKMEQNVTKKVKKISKPRVKKEIVKIVKKAKQNEGNIQVKPGTAPKIIILGDAQEHHEETPEVFPNRCRIYYELKQN